jgi:hypothetical protein
MEKAWRQGQGERRGAAATWSYRHTGARVLGRNIVDDCDSRRPCHGHAASIAGWASEARALLVRARAAVSWFGRALRLGF